MGKTKLLDCTLRDGGYINDWNFGYKCIKGFCEKIKRTNIEYCEVGFIKGNVYDKNKSLFPNIESFKEVIGEKSKEMVYIGMYDTGTPLDIKNFSKYDGTSIDAIRVIFKNSKIYEAIKACNEFKTLGYEVIANFVNTEIFSNEELIMAIKEFNKMKVHALSIVDTFGDLNNKEFLSLVKLFDENMDKDIGLCYHAHNNLQQAFQNSQSLVELNLERDVIIDGCVFGMGRGAGNLNLELFANYLNEKYEKNYHIIPMLEIMDEYLQEIYDNQFWGYSLPLYISASLKVHPNYAIYLASKNTLTEKALYEIMKMISDKDKITYSRELAEKYYEKYQENFIDDKEDKQKLCEELKNKNILILAPGNSLNIEKDKILSEINKENNITIALNFYSEAFSPQYVFSSNMRRYNKIDEDNRFKSIITSNMREAIKKDFVFNYSNLISKEKNIEDNSGIMLLRLLIELGIKNVKIAGMDGYCKNNSQVYVDEEVFYDFSNEAELRNKYIKEELNEIKKYINISFITNSIYI